MNAASEVLYYGRQLRSSLGWLVTALFFGGTPLIVYFTTPDPGLGSLFMAVALGVPLFLLSLHDLGESSALLLLPETRRVKYVEGFFRKRIQEEFAYEDVDRVEIQRFVLHSSRGAGGEGWYSIRVVLKRKGEIVLEESTYERARRCAIHIATALGVHAFDSGTAMKVALVDVPRRPHLSARAMFWRTLLYGFVLVVLTACLSSILFRFFVG